MHEPALGNLLAVVAIGFAAPLLLGFVPWLPLPAVVLEIVAGIVVGPSGLGWVSIDEPVAVLALIGLAMLLFLAGVEIEFERLRGRTLRIAGTGFAVSVALAALAGLALHGAGLVKSPLLAGVILTATSLGVVVPVLKDAGQSAKPFGQLVIAACSIADFGAILLLTLFFGGKAGGTGARIVLLASFVLLLAVAAVVVIGAERSSLVSDTLRRLQDTTAQIRVRGAFVLLIAFAALAHGLGLEDILGAFAAGALLSALDRDREMTHPQFRLKLEAVGYGVFIPVFFVASGLRFDLDALFSSASTVARVPAFLAALVIARGLPALLYRRDIGTRSSVIAGLLQATSLPFIVAATEIGLAMGLITRASSAAFVAAGLLSVIVFPPLSAALLRRGGPPARAA